MADTFPAWGSVKTRYSGARAVPGRPRTSLAPSGDQLGSVSPGLPVTGRGFPPSAARTWLSHFSPGEKDM